jgi:hypothetical protein
MKIMASHSSATVREPHANRKLRSNVVVAGLKERAQAVLSLDETGEDGSSRERIEALAEIICGSGEEASAALFVLMGMMQNSTEPRVVANTVKHFAFTRCGELNVFGMVDAQVGVVEGELLERDRPC